MIVTIVAAAIATNRSSLFMLSARQTRPVHHQGTTSKFTTDEDGNLCAFIKLFANTGLSYL